MNNHLDNLDNVTFFLSLSNSFNRFTIFSEQEVRDTISKRLFNKKYKKLDDKEITEVESIIHKYNFIFDDK